MRNTGYLSDSELYFGFGLGTAKGRINKVQAIVSTILLIIIVILELVINLD